MTNDQLWILITRPPVGNVKSIKTTTFKSPEEVDAKLLDMARKGYTEIRAYPVVGPPKRVAVEYSVEEGDE